MGWLGWAIIVGGPLLCAGAGALVAHLAHRGPCEGLQNRAYEDGWREGRDRAAAFTGTMVPEPRTVVLHRLAPVHHAAPQPSVHAAAADAAVLLIRGEFDAIRARFDLAPYGSLGGPQAAGLAPAADRTGPPSGELLRQVGTVVGPPWADAPRVE